MQTVPKFKIYDDQTEPEGVFVWGNARDEIFDRYFEASDTYYMGEMAKAKRMLKDILKEDPHFIDGHNLLGNIELQSGNPQKAYTHHKKAAEIGEQIIPRSFDGKIRWGFTENRPFLRALNARAHDLLDQGELEKAVQLFDKILNYNPQDNQGVRLLIGDLNFVIGDTQKAGAVYKKNLDYPPYLYSYGLLHFSRQNYTKAAKFFRKGICANIYISDLLRGKLPLIDYQIWHGTNYEFPEIAYSYLDIMSLKWIEYPDALNLLSFLHIAEPSRSEIEEIYLLKQDLFYSDSGFSDMDFEHDTSTSMRKELLSEIEQIKKSIDDQSSKQLANDWQESESPFNQRFNLS
ncbi:tetratricopeptide repeat protein [Aliifodinibius sp. S!AR15-10]|uniref:tetratricopeptide repeat protein n=1 Tax=Aliifodinibius sp. S!AR15-10 TaxID=2950437 RepID=UPI0028558003|nr:tetratricopeptide repeat protein [Aliifodinibius sp. S!AR15-10]MDR8391910.1 tetratricopeptide repeat protein [Aliifodinibius sp. S!AR15-10]